jgi:hypothetical protein
MPDPLLLGHLGKGCREPAKERRRRANLIQKKMPLRWSWATRQRLRLLRNLSSPSGRKGTPSPVSWPTGHETPVQHEAPSMQHVLRAWACIKEGLRPLSRSNAVPVSTGRATHATGMQQACNGDL